MFFVALMLTGNVVLLNLLISIIGDEYDRFTEMATLKGVQSRAEACYEAEINMHASTRHDKRLFPRYLHVLRAEEPHQTDVGNEGDSEQQGEDYDENASGARPEWSELRGQGRFALRPPTPTPPARVVFSFAQSHGVTCV